MPLESIVAQIAVALSVTSFDVYVFFIVLVLVGVFAIMGLARIYGVFFGAVLGIGIFVLFSTILSPELQTPETLSLVSETFAKVLIGSSVYLIFILTLLVPINGGVAVTLPKNQLGRAFQTIVISLVLILFLVAIFLWLVEKSYIFLRTDSAFALLGQFTFYSEVRNSFLFTFVGSHLPTIIILSIGFIIYKMLFSDIVNTLFFSLIESIKRRKTGGDMGHGGDGGKSHEEQMEYHGGGGQETYDSPHGWHHGH